MRKIQLPLIIEPQYHAKLISVENRKEGKPYPKDNWRNECVGEEGIIRFKYYSHYAEFIDYTLNEEKGIYEANWSLNTSKIIDIKEDLPSLILTTLNSIYKFEVIKKMPEEDTTEYFKLFCTTEERERRVQEVFGKHLN